MKIRTEDLDFSGKRVLITGAASGIGAEMAKTFGEHGASLILADIKKIQKDDRESLSGIVKTIQFDQADPTSIEKMATEVGRVDVLLNNAGVVWMGPFEEMSDLDINRLIAINLVGHITVAQKIGKSMLEQRSGVIINTSSQLAFHGAAERAVYAATKWAVAGLTESLRLEVKKMGKSGVKFSSIHPNFLKKGLFEGTKLNFLGQLLAPGVKSHDAVAKVIVNRAIKLGFHSPKVPWIMNQIVLLRALLPSSLLIKFSSLYGLYDMMDDYKGYEDGR